MKLGLLTPAATCVNSAALFTLTCRWGMCPSPVSCAGKPSALVTLQAQTPTPQDFPQNNPPPHTHTLSPATRESVPVQCPVQVSLGPVGPEDGPDGLWVCVWVGGGGGGGQAQFVMIPVTFHDDIYFECL
jgi:hypothetical protein